jgi:hypothetical protein
MPVKFCDGCEHLPQLEQQRSFNRDALAFLAELAGA